MDSSFYSLSLGSAGMRGMVGDGLTPGAAGDFASAFGTMLAGERILVGCDTRASSRMLRPMVLSALAGCGCEAVDGGVLTAGMMHFLTTHLGFAGGLLITGGHQSAGWNAVIPLGSDGAYLGDITRRELFDLYHGRRFAEVPYSEVRPVGKLPPGALGEYWKFIEQSVDAEAIRGAKLRIIGDYCNGAGAIFCREFARIFQLELTAMNDSPGGVLPRDPEPRPRTESPIRAVIEPLGAAAGLVYNSDMSRLGLLSDAGEPLSEEFTFPLALDYLLEKQGAPATVVTNCCSSRTIDEIVRRHHGKLLKVKVGQAAVIDTMKSREAAACGEGCGAFTFGTMNGFDGFLMTALILEMIARRGKLSAQLKNLPRNHIVKKTLPCRSSHAYTVLRQLRGAFTDAKISEVDGLRFDWPDGWLSLRLSETEPVIRLISESSRKNTALERAWQVRSMLETRGVR